MIHTTNKHTLKSTNLFQNDSISSYLFTFEIIFDMYYVCYDNWTQLNARHRTAGKSQNINHILNLQCDISHIYVYFDADFFLSFDLIFFLLHYLCHLLCPFITLCWAKIWKKCIIYLHRKIYVFWRRMKLKSSKIAFLKKHFFSLEKKPGMIQ